MIMLKQKRRKSKKLRETEDKNYFKISKKGISPFNVHLTCVQKENSKERLNMEY